MTSHSYPRNAIFFSLGAICVYRIENHLKVIIQDEQWDTTNPSLPTPHSPWKSADPMQVHILERILFDVIACTVILVGLYLYTYLVSIYQSRHWVSIQVHSKPPSQNDAFNSTHKVLCI